MRILLSDILGPGRLSDRPETTQLICYKAKMGACTFAIALLTHKGDQGLCDVLFVLDLR